MKHFLKYIHTKSFIRVHVVLTFHLASSSFKLNTCKKVISLFNNYPVVRSKEDTHVSDGATRAIGLWSLPGLDIVLYEIFSKQDFF